MISDGFKSFEKVSVAYLAAHWFSILAGLCGLAAVLVLQWCVVLISAGLLPLKLWV